jgi:Ca2+/Na+ antiporter
MAGVNTRRVALGAVLGAVVWNILGYVVDGVILAPHYPEAQAAGHYLKEPRYPFFMFYWIVTIFIVAYILAWFYAAMRGTMGPGPGTALKVGFFAGFTIAFPMSLAEATWLPADRIFVLWHMVDLWVGAILSKD